MRSEERLRRIERATDFSLFVLALALIPLLIGPWVLELSPTVDDVVLLADWLIWGVFSAVFATKLAVAPARMTFLRQNWIEGLMVALPMLRPLRVLRVLRLVRVATAIGLNAGLLQKFARNRGTQFTVGAVLIVMVSGAVLVLLAEKNADGANITTLGDALWWAATTMTTVGYGDFYPTTPAGRGVAVALMLLGIAALSALTATIAAFLVQEHENVELVDVMRKLDELQAEISALREGSGSARGNGSPADRPEPRQTP